MNIALVEDDAATREKTAGYCRRFQKETNEQIRIREFSDGKELVDHYDPSIDLIFLDIEMKEMNGMEAAEAIRKKDRNVMIVFLTNMGGYAIRGYSVQATDYILKPLSYPVFCCKMKEWLKRVEQHRGETVVITNGEELFRISTDRLFYVEVSSHRLIYHTDGEDISFWGSLKSAEELLQGKGFARCNSCYLVNLRYVQKISGNQVYVGNTPLQISRPRKKTFMEAVARYMGGV